MEIDESRLIAQASKGSAAAFNQLMGIHEKRMYAVALRVCSNREDAQDCLQNAMIRIYRAIGSFKGESSFSTWVYRITMNTCLDELRKQKNKKNVSLDGLYDSGWSPTDIKANPEGDTIRKEIRGKLGEMIAELPEEMRSAIVLRDIHGYSYEEIASILDTNVGTVKSRISRGREKLRINVTQNAELFDVRGV